MALRSQGPPGLASNRGRREAPPWRVLPLVVVVVVAPMSLRAARTKKSRKTIAEGQVIERRRREKNLYDINSNFCNNKKALAQNSRLLKLCFPCL